MTDTPHDFSSVATADMTAAVDAWLVRLADTLAARTRIAYGIDLRFFLSYLAARLKRPVGVADVAALELSDGRVYCAHLASQGRSPASIARAVAALRGFFRALADAGLVAKPTLNQLAPPKVVRRVRPLPAEDAERALAVVAALSDTPWVAKRDEALFALLYGSGLRLGEALALTRAQAPSGENLTVGSGHRSRTVPVLPAVPALLADYLRACPFPPRDDQPLFVGAQGGRLNPGVVQRQLRRLRGLLGLSPQATPRALRQVFATRLRAAGNDWRAIQRWLGHAHLATTRRYAATPTKG